MRHRREPGGSVSADKLMKSQIRTPVVGLRDFAAVLKTDPTSKAEVRRAWHAGHTRPWTPNGAGEYGNNASTTERVGEAYSTISTRVVAHRMGCMICTNQGRPQLWKPAWDAPGRPLRPRCTFGQVGPVPPPQAWGQARTKAPPPPRANDGSIRRDLGSTSTPPRPIER